MELGIQRNDTYICNIFSDKMKLVIQFALFLWISLSIVLGLFSTLTARKETNAYRQIFIWFVAPFITFAGLIFIDKGNKKDYFKRIFNDLFMK